MIIPIKIIRRELFCANTHKRVLKQKCLGTSLTGMNKRRREELKIVQVGRNESYGRELPTITRCEHSLSTLFRATGMNCLNSRLVNNPYYDTMTPFSKSVSTCTEVLSVFLKAQQTTKSTRRVVTSALMLCGGRSWI